MARQKASATPKEVVSLRLRQMMAKMNSKTPLTAAELRAQMRVLAIYANVNRVPFPEDVSIQGTEFNPPPPKAVPPDEAPPALSVAFGNELEEKIGEKDGGEK